MLRLWQQSSQYLQVPSDPEGSKTHEVSSREEIENNEALESFTGKFSRLSPQALVSVCVIVAVITGVVGFGAGAFIFKEPKHFSHVVDVVPRGLHLNILCLLSSHRRTDLSSLSSYRNIDTNVYIQQEFCSTSFRHRQPRTDLGFIDT